MDRSFEGSEWGIIMCNNWISVDDRLPEIEFDTGYSQLILVVEKVYGVEKSLVSVGSLFRPYVQTKESYFKSIVGHPINVTHWQPLPEPPNVESKQETVTISKEEYEDLLDDSFWLGCLEAAGVDNWQGIEYAYELHIQYEDAD